MKQTYEQEIEALKKEISSKNGHIETLSSELATLKNEK
jgi:predicted  nucleic acid-binding Zn-ribbon protein